MYRNQQYTVHLNVIITLMLFTGVISVANKPNIVIFLADDMGYGDLFAYGNPISKTPNIDALIEGGLQFTQFYSAASVCSPARAGLLTGRYPVRTGIWNYDGRIPVVLQILTSGLPVNETTIPEMIADQGYKSALTGKWHLGVGRQREFLPRNHGFDHFFGLPHTHEDCPCTKCFYPDGDCFSHSCNNDVAPCQLMLDDEIIEQPVDMLTLSVRLARASRSWIQEYSSNKTPFFLLHSFLHPHYPQYADKTHRNSTIGGEYMDSLAELDWQVGEVMDELKKSGVIGNTLIIFTSDNGPDLREKDRGGFSGLLRCGKGTTFEGGSRVPTIAYWPGHVPHGVSTELLNHLDIWPTIRNLIGSSPDDYDIVLDGFDFSDVLLNNGKSPRSSMLYYGLYSDPTTGPFALRTERYKAHFATQAPPRADPDDFDEICRAGSPIVIHSPPLVYDLLRDPEERRNIGNLTEFQVTVEMLTSLMTQESARVEFGESSLNDIDPAYQLCCNAGCQPYPSCCQCPSNYTDDLLPVNDIVISSSSFKVTTNVVITFILVFCVYITY